MATPRNENGAAVSDSAQARRPVRVLVADDHPVVREGVAQAIRRHSDLALVREVENGVDALEAIRSLRPEVALVDRDMPGLDGLQVVASVIHQALPTRVVMLADSVAGTDVYESITAGAAGYVSKREPLRVLREAIRTVASGGRFLSADAEATLLDQLQLRTTLTRPLLTQRELEILRLTGEGMSSSAVGQELHLSQSTVKNHLQHIYDKLGVSNAPAAIHQAMRHGLLR